MYAGPPTSSSSLDRPNSSLSVTRSIASPRSESLTILSKMRRCASRKKSAESITSAARLKASLWRRIAPRTERSASRLCGSVRSATAVSAIRSGGGGRNESVAENWDSGFGVWDSDWSGIWSRDSDSDSAFQNEFRQIPNPESPATNPESQIPNPDALLAFADDLHLHFGGEVAVQLDWDVEFTDLLDRLGQLDLAPLDLEALGRQPLRDVGRRHRAVERLGLADLARDHNLDRGQAIRHRLRDLQLVGFLRLELRAFALDLFLVAVGGEQRQLARQEVVARVAVGDFHHLAAAPQVVDVLSENHFHNISSTTDNAELAERAECLIPWV